MRTISIRILCGLFILGLVWIIILATQGKGFWGFLEAIPYGDKLGHIGLIGTLSLLVNLSLRGRRATGHFDRFLLGSCLIVLVMTIEELSQVFFPNRTLDALDWLANMGGVLVGDIFARLILQRLKRHKID